LFFFNFNKVPFTCSYLPAKSHLAFLAAAYLYGFTIYAFTMADVERWVAESPGRTVWFFAMVAAVLLMLGWYRRQAWDSTMSIIYEDNADPVVRQLNLTA
jgi:hypothetical protein